ncbi:hypothetical protein CLV98_11630 [Dyadobacter jejuensis]|uniref:Uncharacterized protein n=1 Tax=Dyadobacter jejuensis TaxID=1082580 RepID=A0A316ACY2_9BACT|nr:hypothetical protein CLV98_11630 [Dyadobacter jejuensis]
MEPTSPKSDFDIHSDEVVIIYVLSGYYNSAG